MPDIFDLVVLGAGPGGYVAAREAANRGLRTALIEKDSRLGGTSLSRGCLPTKALIQALEAWKLCRGGSRAFGVNVTRASFDWTEVQKRKQSVTDEATQGVRRLIQQAGVTVIHGVGRLDGPGRVLVEQDRRRREIVAAKIILATGSRPAGLPGLTPDGRKILTSDHLLEIDDIPSSLIVLGAGAVGVELAGLMQGFGCRVTLVEKRDRLLPLEDPECSEEVDRALTRQGMIIRAGCRGRAVEATAGGVRCILEDRISRTTEEVEAACLLLAVGRRPATRDIGLETVAAVRDKRGFIQTDGFMETAEPGLYAVGDIVPTPQRAHVAREEARIASGHAAGHEVPPLKYGQVPFCTYGSPEVASIGLTAGAAREAGFLVREGRFPLASLGKAIILDQPHGLVKMVADADTGRILGVHMVGSRVTELIGAAATALGFGADVSSWSEVILPHPTLSEGLGAALLAMNDHPQDGE